MQFEVVVHSLCFVEAQWIITVTLAYITLSYYCIILAMGKVEDDDELYAEEEFTEDGM